ncbi:MAG: Bifunctional protein glmU [uncultured bacterium]|nr:MAG: Bifunctional protein glmU [uncultured bacterium]
MNNIAFIILAAGKGVRMQNTEIPKPMQLLAGRPLVGYILETFEKIGITKNQTWIVTHYLEEQIQNSFPGYNFVHQPQIDGSAKAVEYALAEIGAEFDQIFVINADDSMFYRSGTIASFIDDFQSKKWPMSLITVKKELDSLGSVIRDKSRAPMEIWPESKCREQNLKIKEIVCGTYLFDRQWLSASIDKLKPMASGEIGLPYLLEIAYQENHPANIFELKNPNEWMSVNTPSELKEAEKLNFR